MKQVVKMLAAMSLIAICLTSDTVSSASQFQVSRFKVQECEPHSLMNSVAFVGTTPKLQSWETASWTPRQSTLPCAYLRP